MRSFRALFVASCLVGGVVVGVDVVPAAAATLSVTNCANSGAGSLRQAVASAAAGDTINFAMSPACSTIDDPTGTILITKNLTINGPGANALAVSGSNAVGIFYIYSGVTVSISGLTIENAAVSSGGGIYNDGTLSLTNSTLSGNTATSDGGGIYNTGTLTVSHTTLSGNSVSANSSGSLGGGGIYNSGTLTVTDSTFSTNSASNAGNSSPHGGAIYNVSGTAMVSNSTLSGNTANGAFNAADGGAIFDSGMLTVTNSTLAGNVAEGYGSGGAIDGTYNISNSTLTGNSAYNGGALIGTGTISNSTLFGNSASYGGGVYAGGTVSLRGTFLANSSIRDCYGAVTDNGYNIDDDGTCGFTLPSISDYTTLNKTLGPLASNGGPTQTIALLAANPAIDYVPAADCPPTDQRGDPRTAPCDIGAYDTDTAMGVSPCTGDCITSSPSDPVAAGSFFSFPVTTSGSPSPKIKEKGKLPRGVKFRKGTGTAILSGTPTSTKHKSAVGTYPITITATFGKGKTKQVVTQAFTLNVT